MICLGVTYAHAGGSKRDLGPSATADAAASGKGSVPGEKPNAHAFVGRRCVYFGHVRCLYVTYARAEDRGRCCRVVGCEEPVVHDIAQVETTTGDRRAGNRLALGAARYVL